VEDESLSDKKKDAIIRSKLRSIFNNRLIIIDEIQKVPALLDEVHWLIENARASFILCGSSARKLKRGHANLLGGRALRFELLGLTAKELQQDFDLERLLNRGTIPSIYADDAHSAYLRSYCADYLREEIAAEGLVRNLPAFTRFLEVAAIGDTEQTNYATIARDIGLSAPTVKSYYEILEDTLILKILPSYRLRPKRRIDLSSKAYFFDVGVVNHLNKRGYLRPGSELFGKAFENWVHHELRCYRNYFEPDLSLAFWRLSTGLEVDFIINQMEIAIEAKSTAKVTSDHLKGLREIKVEHPKIKRRIVVCLESKRRITEDGIEIVPYREWAFGLDEFLR
jgi:predicted AAA+ superfamily ATPase